MYLYRCLLSLQHKSTCGERTGKSSHPVTACHRNTCPAVRHAHSHTVCTPSIITECMDSVNGQSQRHTDVCSHEQPPVSATRTLMVYPHPAVAHESYTRLHSYCPASPADDELCLAFCVATAMKINQLLFQTVKHKCVGFHLTFVEIW